MLPEIKKGNRLRLSKILTSGYVVALPVALGIAVLGILISGIISTSVYNNPGLVLALEIAAASEFVSVIFNLTQGVLVGLGKVVEATIANAAYSVFYLVGSVAFVLLGYGVAGAVAGMLLGLVVGSIFGVIYMLKYIGFGIAKPDTKDVKEIGAFSAPVMASYSCSAGCPEPCGTCPRCCDTRVCGRQLWRGLQARQVCRFDNNSHDFHTSRHIL